MAVQRERVEAVRELSAMAERVELLLEGLEEISEEARSRLAAKQVEWFQELFSFLEEARRSLEPRKLSPRDLPAVLRRRLMSSDGKRFVIMACPGKDIWEEEAMKEFVESIRAVDPEATGTPIQVYESSWRMKRGFLLAALYSLCATFVLLIIDLKSLRDTALAMIPLVSGLLWLFELLPLLGLEFNLANFFALPILIGCGIDGGVHILHRFREAGRVEDVSRATCSAVALSFLTTMVGFGAMLVAHHRGVASLGLLMVIGLSCLLVASVVVLPASLRLVEEWRARNRKATRGEGGAVESPQPRDTSFPSSPGAET
jgi:predicted RND superfamily exporter protein